MINNCQPLIDGKLICYNTVIKIFAGGETTQWIITFFNQNEISYQKMSK